MRRQEITAEPCGSSECSCTNQKTGLALKIRRFRFIAMLGGIYEMTIALLDLVLGLDCTRSRSVSGHGEERVQVKEGPLLLASVCRVSILIFRVDY